MTFQTIIDSAAQIEFDRRRIIGQTVSRSQRIKTAERAATQPWTLTVTPSARFNFTRNRSLLESITVYDRATECLVNLANNPKLSYLTAYQGEMDPVDFAALTITNFTATSVTIGGLPTTSTSTVIFRAGDWIQPALSRYPYTITADVVRGTESVVTATVHRPLISSEATTITGAVLIGNSCTLRVVAAQIPTYTLVYKDQFQFNDAFKFVEKII